MCTFIWGGRLCALRGYFFFVCGSLLDHKRFTEVTKFLPAGGGGCHSNPSEWRGARGATTTTRPPSPQLFVTLISPTGSIPWEKRPPAIYHPSPIPCHRPTASAATRGTTKGTLPSTGGVCPPAAFKGECTAALIHVSNLHGLYLK